MRKITTDDFIKRSIEKHGKKYDYSLTKYKNMKSKVKIIYRAVKIFSYISENKKGYGIIQRRKYY